MRVTAMSVPAWLRWPGRPSSPPEPLASADRAAHAGRSAFALRRALPALLLLPVLLVGLLSGAGSVAAEATLPTVSVSDAQVSEDGTWMTFKVSLSQPSSEQVTVRFATSGGTARSGTDFRAVSRTLTIYPNETMTYESVLVYDDQTPELDETFTVTLTNPTHATLGDATATGTIVDDGDTAPRLTASDIEDTTATLTISGHTGGWWYRDRDTGTSQWGACTAVSAGTTAVSISGLTAVTTYDYRAYSDSACSKKLAKVKFRTLAPKGTLTVSVSDAEVSEDGTWMKFEVSLSHASREEVTVEIRTSGGTATPRTYTPSYVMGDYRDESETRTFAASETWLHFAVLVYDDQVPEPDETFTVTLTNPKGATLGDATATGTIKDDGDTAARLTASDIEDTTATLTISGHAGSWWYRGQDTGTSRWGACTAVSAGTTAVSISGLTTVKTYYYTAYSDSACSKRLAGMKFRTLAPKGTPTVSVSDAKLTEDGTWMTFKVSLSQPSRERVVVRYVTSDGTATGGTDFRAEEGSRAGWVFFSANSSETTSHANVIVYDDQEPEPDETFTVTLTNPKGATLGDATATGTIKDDDGYTAATISFARGTEIIREDWKWGKKYLEVKLGKAAPSDLTFAYTVGGTATAGSDFTIDDSGTLSVPKGATTAFIPVTIIDDSLPESNETVVLTLVGSGGYDVVSPGTHTLTIDENEPQVSFASASQSVGEGSGTHNVGVRLNGWAATDTTFTYTVGGTATAGSDFTIANSGTVTMLAGAAGAAIPVTIIDDSVEDSGETVVLTLTAGNGYAVGAIDTHTLTIQNYELLDGTVVTIAAGTSPVTEGGDATFTITANPAPASPLEVWVTIAAEGDYGVTAGGVTLDNRTVVSGVSIPTTGSRTLTLATVGDDADEPDGSVTVTVMNKEGYAVGASGSGTVAIRDDDEASVSFASASQSVGEGSGTHNVEVRLSPAPATDTTFIYTVDGTATAGSDFTIANSGTLSVPKGTTTATIPVTIIDDSVEDGGETVVLKLTAGNGYAVGTIGTHTLTIQNHEPAVPSVTVARKAGTASSITEGGDAAFTLTATPVPTADLAVSVTVATDGAWGVTAGTRTVTIPTTGSATLTLPTIGDEADEPDGSVTVTVTDGDGYKVGSPASDTVAIGDDDLPPPVVTIAAGASVTEGGDAVFTLTANPAPAADLAVTVTIGTDGDFGIAAGERTVTIPTAGSATLTLATTGDSADEPDGSVTVTVKDGDGYTVGAAASDSVTVRDDDDTTPDWTDYQTVVSYLVEVRDNPKNTAVKGNPVHIAKWNRVLEAVGHDTGTGVAPMAASVIHANAAQWPDSPFKAASVYLKSKEQDPDEPAVTVSAGTSPVTEGGSATFTLTATPPPASALAVTVTVATDGAYGITAGPQTVTIPTTGSATLTLPTTDDGADEPDGSVTVTVTDGHGYTVGSAASGTVAIQDDDAPATTPDWTDYQAVVNYLIEVRDNPKNTAVKGNPVHIAKWNRVLEALGHDTGTGLAPMAASEIHANAAQWPDSPFKAASVYLKSQEPAVTVSAGTSPVTEGGDAVFTLTATPPPAADLPVSVTVATDGAWGVTAGPRTVTIPTSGSATLTLATTGDNTDEPDGSVTVTVTDGDGYTVGSPASGSVTVRDDDEPPPDTPAVTLSAGSAVTEGGSATFTLTASPAPAADLAVSVTVAATGAYGIAAGPQTVTIPTTGIVTLTLATTDDTTNEPDGSVTVTVTDGSGYTVGDPASDTVAIRDDDVPVVTVSAGSAVTEGGNASFTLTANPVPAASLAVSVTVAAAGEYGVTAGKRTVTLPTTGSTTLTLTTTDDAADEPDGSVSVTVEDGEGYTVGASASGTITLRDDDEPPPVVTIAAKAASVTEGGDATFTLTADRASASALTVELAVSETGAGDHVAAADEGPATVTIPKDATEATFSVATVNDATDEPDSSASVAVQPGAGYTVGAPASASVEVTDDDAPSAAPALSVGDSTAKEGARFPVMPFTVRLTPPAPGPVRVHVSTRPSAPVSAEPGRDYAPGSSALTFRAGETEKQVWILIYDDSHDEGAETFEVVLSNAQGATIGDGVAVGTIVNDDPMPAAWLARFGRTVAEQALDGIAHRMAAPRTPGMQGTLAGLALGFGAPAGGHAGPDDAAAGASVLDGTGALALADVAQAFGGDSGRPGLDGIDGGFGHDAAGFGNGFGETRTLTAREALLGSSFTLTGEADSSGGTAAFWGRAAQGRFDGREGTFSLDGAVTTGMLGADYARGRWLIGLALAQSDGEGDYRDTKAMPRPPEQVCSENRELCDGAVRTGDGKVAASVTAAIPYAALRVSERLKLWGAAGHGAGEVTLKTAMGGSYSADTSWRMAAAGLRGDLLGAPAQDSGPALAVTSDALWARTSSDRTRDLAASDSDVSRLRLGLEGSWRVAIEGGGQLTPKLELGARHDGGDAETGFGLELGGGLAWSDPALGLTLDVSGRALLAHENDDLEDRGFAASLGFDPSPASERGPSLTLRQAFGGQAAGGLDALFAPDPLEDRMSGEAASRWTMEAAYGVPAFGGRFTGSPHVGLGLSAAARDYTLGWRWTPEAASTPDLSFGFRAMRRESDSAAPEHTVGFEIRATW